MISQPSLFDVQAPVTLPYAKGSDTSKAAAKSARWFSEKQGRRIYEHIVKCGPCGATDKELERVLGICRQAICARRKGLREAGMIEDSGQRREGCSAWKATGV